MNRRKDLVHALFPGTTGYIFRSAEDIVDIVIEALEEQAVDWTGADADVIIRFLAPLKSIRSRDESIRTPTSRETVSAGP